MLGFCWDKNMLKLYKKLCRYYYGIDEHAAASYVYAYKEMWHLWKVFQPRLQKIIAKMEDKYHGSNLVGSESVCFDRIMGVPPMVPTGTLL